MTALVIYCLFKPDPKDSLKTRDLLVVYFLYIFVIVVDRSFKEFLEQTLLVKMSTKLY